MHLGALEKNWIKDFYIFKYNFKKNLILLKLCYLVLDLKLLINHEEYIFRKSIDTKNLTKPFTHNDIMHEDNQRLLGRFWFLQGVILGFPNYGVPNLNSNKSHWFLLHWLWRYRMGLQRGWRWRKRGDWESKQSLSLWEAMTRRNSKGNNWGA